MNRDAVVYAHVGLVKRTEASKWDENEVADNRFQRSELEYLIYNDPLGYADLILNSKLNVLFE